MGAPDSPVRQPRHLSVRVLTVSIVGALTSWGTGKSGAELANIVNEAALRAVRAGRKSVTLSLIHICRPR